ncbi:hypothetical protein R3P38DRAFT_3200479 [Favolaschia claudopus]|uniref:Uncharacterized protein n=1 Tax=Favolaschia claudopus TaxID=2862362 RepID=A0AAW0AY92_9AGAR
MSCLHTVVKTIPSSLHPALIPPPLLKIFLALATTSLMTTMYLRITAVPVVPTPHASPPQALSGPQRRLPLQNGFPSKEIILL